MPKPSPATVAKRKRATKARRARLKVAEVARANRETAKDADKMRKLRAALRDWPPHMKLPEKYRDGSWWCINRPGCAPFACAGHGSFVSAVLAAIPNVRKLGKP